MVNFEVGEWYKMNYYNEDCYMKFAEIKENKIYSSEYIYNKRLQVKKGYFGRIGNYDFKLLTDLSEIQKYLPLGHRDTIINNIHELW